MLHLRRFVVATSLLALACGAPVRLEDLRAQVDAMPAGQAELDLWVPDAVTLDGSPAQADVVTALIVERALARGLFPHGFTAGPGGRMYHYRQGPPHVPGVPSASERRVVPRVLTAGAAYQVHATHFVFGGGNVLALDLRVTVAAVDATRVVLDVVVERGTMDNSKELLRDVRFELTIPSDPDAPPAGTTGDDSPNRFVFREPPPDEDTRSMVTGFFASFGFAACLVPSQPHRTGEKWNEAVQTWFFGRSSIAWEAGPVAVHAGGAVARYDAVWHIPPTKDAPPTLAALEVGLHVHLEDGFAGDCGVKNFMLGPDYPTTVSRITSTRIAG